MNKTLVSYTNKQRCIVTFARILEKMNCKRFYIFCFVVLFALSAHTQPKITLEEYIRQYSEVAVKEMELYRIPASITLAQGILESGAGKSPLALEANNHFGIKCHKEWTGKTFYMDDDEKDECFRKYNKAWESYRDHSEFLTTRDRYRFLFDYEISDYKNWAYGLKKAGYATNPRYPDLLIKIIEENKLDKYDKAGSRQLSVVSRQSSVVSRQSAVVSNESDPESKNPEPSYELFGRGGNDRVIFLNNGVKFIIARAGDDFRQIAAEFEIYTWQLYAYNDMDKRYKISAGQKVYLEKKKRRAKFDKHNVQAGENLHSISQDYGVRLKVLCRKNLAICGGDLKEGIVIKLR